MMCQHRKPNQTRHLGVHHGHKQGDRAAVHLLAVYSVFGSVVVCIQIAESVFKASVSGLDTSGRIWVSGRGFLGLPQ